MPHYCKRKTNSGLVAGVRVAVHRWVATVVSSNASSVTVLAPDGKSTAVLPLQSVNIVSGKRGRPPGKAARPGSADR